MARPKPVTTHPALRVAAASLVVVLSGACVANREVRTAFPAAANDSPGLTSTTDAPDDFSVCNPGHPTRNEDRRLIQDYGNYVVSYVEFDDQGWSFGNDAQLKAVSARLQAEAADPRFAGEDFAVMLFVHGWHHNAHENDCNVQEAKLMVQIASERFDIAFANHEITRKRRIFGVYVGWRGESVDADGLRYATILDRRDAAEKVAKGSVRALFASLHEVQQAARNNSRNDPSRKTPQDVLDRMYTSVVGHSFGGLIVFNAMSQQFMNELTASCVSPSPDGTAPGGQDFWPDQVVLINPAFEASRFEPINRLADAALACGYTRSIPLLTVVTADNDRWTGWVFTLGRRLLTLFETYDETTAETTERERDTNIRAIGFVDRYRTHRLCLRGPDAAKYATASLIADTPGVPVADPRRVVWVVGAPPSIVDGHDGFLYARNGDGGKNTPQPYLLDWLIDLHLDRERALGAPALCNSGRKERGS